MKLSSYHKQRGDNINFVTDIHQVGLSFDRMYIARVDETTEVPSKKLLDDSRVMLLGKGFQYYGAKAINAVVAGCRPDYLLYPIDEHNPYANANFVQFYCGKSLLKQKQDYHSTFRFHKKTVVVDAWFWKAEDEEIIRCLEELKHEKNVAFLKPISLQRIVSNTIVREKFLALHFSPGTAFKWKNDLAFTQASVDIVLDLLQSMRKKTRSDLGHIPFKIKLNGTEEDEIILAECFAAIDKFKAAKMQCLFLFDGVSRFKPIANQISAWTQYNLTLSYVEHVTHTQSMIEGLPWYDIVNYSYKWRNNQIDWLLYLLTAPI